LRTLRSCLIYEPRELSFGTSGRRGPVADLTQLEIFINVLAELQYLKSLSAHEGGIRAGDEFYFAHDLRPSSVRFDGSEGGRGEICQAVERAIREAGLRPVDLGAVPTPALTYYALSQVRGSIMVTGSHIPFDLNGYKLNTSVGELLKQHEEPIGQRVARVRDQVYGQPFDSSPFNEQGMFREGHLALSAVSDAARDAYRTRYESFFGSTALKGKRVLVYQHSAVGRDLLFGMLEALGAEAIPVGRSETFVAIDTEAIDDTQLETIQQLADAATRDGRTPWAVVSTDGDSDRPLILGVEGGKVKFFGGDLVGMIVAEYLGADAVVVPISCNDGIDRGPLAEVVEPKTRIGSPYVIAGMAAAREKGRKRVCGWEANGGFLLGSPTERGGRTLAPLPTRDAMLPIFAVLSAAAERNVTLPELFSTLPHRYSRAALLRNFPRAVGRYIVETLTAYDDAGQQVVISRMERFFTAAQGFSAIAALDYTDGVRIIFRNGEVAHFRPSGNADEFRMYAVADTQERANRMVAAGTEEPDGIIRRMQRELERELAP
jgi:phosphomannomutase